MPAAWRGKQKKVPVGVTWSGWQPCCHAPSYARFMHRRAGRHRRCSPVEQTVPQVGNTQLSTVEHTMPRCGSTAPAGASSRLHVQRRLDHAVGAVWPPHQPPVQHLLEQVQRLEGGGEGGRGEGEGR